MTHMVGKNWRDFFDVIIVHADKPHFFTDCVKWVIQAYTEDSETASDPLTSD